MKVTDGQGGPQRGGQRGSGGQGQVPTGRGALATQHIQKHALAALAKRQLWTLKNQRYFQQGVFYRITFLGGLILAQKTSQYFHFRVHHATGNLSSLKAKEKKLKGPIRSDI